PLSVEIRLLTAARVRGRAFIRPADIMKPYLDVLSLGANHALWADDSDLELGLGNGGSIDRDKSTDELRKNDDAPWLLGVGQSRIPHPRLRALRHDRAVEYTVPEQTPRYPL